MYKLLMTILIIVYCSSVFAVEVDVVAACNERDEQKSAWLANSLSTSPVEAFMAGQCIGFESTKVSYWGYDKFSFESFSDLPKSCVEFVEKKEALLSFLSTSLSEAMHAGMCVGAIYKVAFECDRSYQISYLRVAKSINGLSSQGAINYIADHFDCNGY
ncbi:hypothetical protein Q4601_14315 [Shewanella sp. 1_MG-2023]|uniref:hypothetical protein n=1 Tax=unclassified Shewanella TaxID=196818 RepID=UPI0026E47922|nr:MULTISPECIES: hypothetical protein [unclassified Shewanella]MDO6611383.1 hypothetical protein [Shewanella sp. 7_MG-2023]MDO6771238.1 hypothetical protein [Shewanella sp. 2_MG-2023]MDO6795479.1 hypothetical protein [Shewanella sp. 1_MG-2023]